MVRRLRDREVGSASGSAPDYRPPDTLHSRSHFGYCTERCRDTTIDHRPSGSLSDRRGTSAATAAAAAVERGGVVTRKRGGGPRHSSFTRNLSVAFSAPPANAMPLSGMLRRVPEALYIIGSLGSVRSGGSVEPRVSTTGLGFPGFFGECTARLDPRTLMVPRETQKRPPIP